MTKYKAATEAQLNMRTVIKGKRYDTAKAHMVASDESRSPVSDFRWWYEELYVTPRGRWFVAGKGHAMSRWAESDGVNGYGPGSGIRPMTPDEAMEWLEQAEEHAAIEHYFPEQLEDA